MKYVGGVVVDLDVYIFISQETVGTWNTKFTKTQEGTVELVAILPGGVEKFLAWLVYDFF